MGDIALRCTGCGTKFVWTEKEQKEFEENAVDAAGAILEVEPYCKGCRPKQDGQRS